MHLIRRFRAARRVPAALAFLSLTLIVLFFSIVLPGSAAARPGQGEERSSWYQPGQIQLQLAPGARIADINARYATATLDSLPPLYLLSVTPGTEEAHITAMTGDPEIVHVEYSYSNNTPEAERQMVVAAVGGTIDDYLDQGMAARLHLAEAQTHTRGDGVKIAILDTGVLASHPALAGCISPDGYDYVSDDSIPDDTADGIDEDQDGQIDEGAGHGTMVAGIAHLVAPGAVLLPIRVLDDEGNGLSFDLAKGIRYAREHGAQIINMSLGLQASCGIIAFELEAAHDAGVILVSAAGNDDQDAGIYPGIDSKVLMIASLDSVDVKADFSNFNSKVALSAPGKGILAPYYDGEYAIGAGTSFSVPLISAQAALVRALNPALGRSQVEDAIRAGVVDIYQLPGNLVYVGKLGTGRFDALATVEAVPASAAVAGAVAADLSSFSLTAGPNPFRAPGAIALRLGTGGANFAAAGLAGKAILGSIHDSAGRLVGDPRPTRFSPSGQAVFPWDGRDGEGRLLPPGVYYVRLAAAGEGEVSAPVVLLR